MSEIGLEQGVLSPVIDEVEVIQLAGGGAGSISRTQRLEAYPNLQETVLTAEQEISDAIYLSLANRRYIMRCGDGRGKAENNGGCQLFGGTAGLVKSEVIAGLIPARSSAAEAIADRIQLREEAEIPSGGHRADTHFDETKCGCGECDGAQAAAELYLQAEESLKPLVLDLWTKTDMSEHFGEFDDDMYENALSNLSELANNHYFADGKAQIDAVEFNTAEESVVENLPGKHKEMVWVISMIDGYKFDQPAFLEKYDSEPENIETGINVFWEDQWAAIDEYARNYSGDDLKNALQTDLIRRVATAANLTAADLKILILK